MLDDNFDEKPDEEWTTAYSFVGIDSNQGGSRVAKLKRLYDYFQDHVKGATANRGQWQKVRGF